MKKVRFDDQISYKPLSLCHSIKKCASHEVELDSGIELVKFRKFYSDGKKCPYDETFCLMLNDTNYD